MELTKEQLDEVVAAASGQIRASAIASATEQLSYIVRENVRDTLSQQINEVFKTEIAPKIKAQLMENEPMLVKAAVGAADEMAKAIAAAMIAALTKKLGSEWERKKVLSALFD